MTLWSATKAVLQAPMQKHVLDDCKPNRNPDTIVLKLQATAAEAVPLTFLQAFRIEKARINR